ncbi:MAG: homoserine dehydrogenase [Verrucomicrobiia bacterium]
MQSFPIGLAGLGNVGCGVYRHLLGNQPLLQSRTGCLTRIERIAVKDPKRPRVVEPPPSMLTTDWRDLTNDESLPILIELMGGTGDALAFTHEALNKKRVLITGNKALLAEHGAEIFELAHHQNVPVYFEAAAAGGIPIIKTIREALVGNHIISIHGIVNGTSNYILTRMKEAGLTFEEALREAQDLGYAEADPTLDVNGWDAAHKAIILASLAYGFWIDHRGVLVEGIEKITADDIRFAASLGYGIKLLAVIKSDASRTIELRVVPTLIPQTHVLASVRGAFNAVAVEGDVVGPTLFYGRGAGPDATASAVLSDVADATAVLSCQKAPASFPSHDLYGSSRSAEESVSPFYMRLSVEDRPGVLAQIANVLGRLEIGILSVIQPEARSSQQAPLVLMLHDAAYKQVKEAAAAIRTLPCVKADPHLLWVEHLAEP